MSTFKDIQKKIQEEIESKDILEPVACKGNVDETPELVKVGVKGTVASMPGTEIVTLDANTFQLMECVSAAKGRSKPRYCIVEKGKHAQYGNHFVTAGGDRAHVITREVYTLILGVLNSASAQIKSLTSEARSANERADLHKLTIDALRKNGIID